MNIAWVLSGDRKKASSRLQGFKIHEEFILQGLSSEIIGSDFSIRATSMRSSYFREVACKLKNGQFTHLIAEGPEWAAVQLSQLARCWKIHTIAVRCDRYPADYDRYFDLTILPTSTLRDELAIRRAAIIDDMIECPEDLYKRDYHQRNPKLRVVWVGHQGYSDYIKEFSRELLSHETIAQNFEIITISTGPQFTLQWGETSVFRHILLADIGILPIPDGAWFKTKSSNRLSMMFSLGMPCIASPIESYRQIARDNENIHFASDVTAFQERLLALRDLGERERLGRAARSATDPLSRPQEVARRWASAFHQVPTPFHCTQGVPLKYRIAALFAANR